MLANQYKARLTKILSDGSAVTFVDLVPLLRALGTEALLNQIQNQRDNLLDCLRAAEGRRLHLSTAYSALWCVRVRTT